MKQHIIGLMTLHFTLSITCMELSQNPAIQPKIVTVQNLFKAIARNQLPKVTSLCTTHPQLINTCARDTTWPNYSLPGYCMTPLHLATWLGHHKCMKTLLDHGANANAVDSQFSIPLHCACTEKGITILAGKGSLINHRNQFEITPLFSALFYNHRPSYPIAIEKCLDWEEPWYDVAAVLLKNGANIDDIYHKSCCALDHAVAERNEKLVDFLLTHHANPEIADARGITPFSSLLGEINYPSRRLLKVFEKHGMLFLPKSKQSLDNPFVFVRSYGRWQSVATMENEISPKEVFTKGIHIMARLLRIADANVGDKDKSDLSWGVRHTSKGYLIKKISPKLLEKFIGTDTVDAARTYISEREEQAYMMVKQNNSVALQLHAKKYPFVLEDPSTYFLLKETIEKNHSECLDILLPDPAVTTVDVHVPYVVYSEQLPFREVYKGTFLHLAVQCGNRLAVNKLLRHGINHLGQDSNDKTALELATDLENKRLAKILRRQIMIDAIKAADGYNYATFKKLIEHLPKINMSINDQKMTLLHKVANKHPKRWILKLIALGADIHAQDYHGNTPIHDVIYGTIYTIKETKKRIQLLTSRGAIIGNTIFDDWRYKFLPDDIQIFLKELSEQQNKIQDKESL